MLAAVENTHGPEQMAVEEGDRLTDENCRGYPAVQSGRDEEGSKPNLIFPPANGRVQQTLLVFYHI